MSVSTPGADDLGLELLPPTDAAVTPEQDLSAAIASVLADPLDPREITDDAPQPLGRSWRFDYDAGRFVRAGAGPAAVSGADALVEWATTALHTARFAHPIYSEAFGRDRPNALIGEGVGDEQEADLGVGIRNTLLVHDRIAAVEIGSIAFDPIAGILTISGLTIFTDEDDELNLDTLGVRLADAGSF